MKKARGVSAAAWFYGTSFHTRPSIADCTCYHDCGSCSKSGDWHIHSYEPCPVHPDARDENGVTAEAAR